MGLKLSELANKNTWPKALFVFIWNSSFPGCPLLVWQLGQTQQQAVSAETMTSVITV